MVRLKQRYLLLNILYPEQDGTSTSIGAPPYLKFHGPTPSHINSHAFLNIVKAEITQLFGDHGLGLSLSSLKVIYYSQATSTAILRVPRTYYQIAWAALTLLHELPTQPHSQAPTRRCVVRVLRVSGTIRKAEEELLKRSRREIVRAKLAGSDGTTHILDRYLGSDHKRQPSQEVPWDELNEPILDNNESESE